MKKLTTYFNNKKAEICNNIREDMTPNSKLTVEQRERKTMRAVSKRRR